MAEGEGSNSALSNIVFGSVAGMTAKLFEHPFDLVKVRLQSQPTDRALTFKGPFDCFKQTYTNEGVRGLYRGLSMPVIGAAAENATLFLVYNKCQDLIVSLNPKPLSLKDDETGMSEVKRGKRRELSNPELALAAAGAGAAASFVLTPIELIKCRMQVQMLNREGALATSSSARPSLSSINRSLHTSTRPLHVPNPALPPLEGPVALTINTVRDHGIRGLWLGQMGTLLRETGGSAAWFTTYEVVSKFFLKRRQDKLPHSTPQLTKGDLATYELMLSGACAGIMYNVTLFPADSVKSAVQTWAELNPDKPRLSFIAMGKQIWRTRGLKGMYAGCGMTCLRSGPSSAMIFLIYETLDKHFGHLLR